MKKISLALLSTVLFACSHNPNKAEKIQTEIDTKTNLGLDSQIGLKDGNMVFQKKVLIGEELRDLQIKSHELEAQVYGGRRYFDNRGLWGALKDCREQISLMTDGKLQWTEAREYVIPDEDNFAIGLDEKNALVGVTEEFLKDRLKRFKGYRDVLEKRHDDFNERIRVCQLELKTRQKQGEQKAALPSSTN